MKTTRRWLLAIMVLCLLAPPSSLAAQEPVTLRIDGVNASIFSDVSLLVTVRNEYGSPIPNLGPADFDVSEDRTLQSRPIAAVEPLVNPEAQVAVLLAVDVSGSMTGAKLRDAQEAARRFLDSLSAQDSAALIAFAGDIDLAAALPARERGFDKDKTALYRIVAGLQASGATPLYDAAYKAVRWAAAQPAGNRAVLLFTDGKEERAQDGSGGSQVANDDTAIREANRAGVPVFTIGLGADADEGYLRRLALETGGTYQHAKDSAELAVLFRNVSDLLKQQYRITYTSGLPADGQTHQVLAAVKVGEATAFDEVAFGPVPLAPAPTAPPTEPPPTSTPVEPTPAPQPTVTSVPAVQVIASNASESAPTSTEEPAQDGPLGIQPIWWLLMAVGVLALGGLGVFALGSMGVIAVGRQSRVAPAGVYRCLRCGRALPGQDAECPSCGYKGSYKGDA